MSRRTLVPLVLVLAVGLVCATCAQDPKPAVTKADTKAADESCVEPAQGPIGDTPSKARSAAPGVGQMQVVSAGVRPGDTAPDFEASAFVDGRFENIKLSDYKGKWVVLCFYPGDFTFV